MQNDDLVSWIKEFFLNQKAWHFIGLQLIEYDIPWKQELPVLNVYFLIYILYL